MISTSLSGRYTVESVPADLAARDAKGYLLKPGYYILKNGNPCVSFTLENRNHLAAKGNTCWIVMDGVEYLIANAGHSCVVGYGEQDERYKSVVVNCTTKKLVRSGDITHVDTESMLALHMAYNGYEELVYVKDLSRLAENVIEQVVFQGCGEAEHVWRDVIVQSDAFEMAFYKEEGGKRGIVCVFGEYYRLLNGMAFRDDETTFRGDTVPWKGDPRAVYTSGLNGEPDDYDFLFVQIETIIFVVNAEGKLVVEKRHAVPRRSMTIAEFDALYVRDDEGQNAWLRAENIVPAGTKWLE